uniref:Glycerate kinase n=1 Tax=Petromyzon marinus TaxID=7757 RepID=A0AAJ7T1H3_PETMA|nr:glycerate kinase [Petromyzon marinus]XP_032808607.1 glycerate kinase [Petromyzon marinus]XP_032808608.1 glycerate kinase [Petromyzon marinus]
MLKCVKLHRRRVSSAAAFAPLRSRHDMRSSARGVTRGRDPALCSDAEELFRSAVSAVLPLGMVRRSLRVEGGDTLSAGGRRFPLRRNVTVVGFGKAALGMGRAAEELLGRHVVRGALSVPVGAQESLRQAGKTEMLLQPDTKLRVFEGALNNLPDEGSLEAARYIQRLVEPLRPSDLLLILISGGGSALLPAPVPPVSLQEKQEVTRLLATRGAAIGELNAVRRGLSLLKGGGLARLARPAQVVTLILSDVVGDPLEAIASGPTVRNPTTPSDCLDVLGRYELLGRVAPSVLHHLSHLPSPRSDDDDDLSHVLNLVVGSSGLALEEACAHAARLGYEPLALSRSVTGDVADAAEFYSRLIAYACRRLRSRGGPTGGGDAEGAEDEVDEVEEVEEAERLKEAATRCGVGDLSMEALADTVAIAARRRGGRLCVACGGETTVSVRGDGRGGRNQELALRVARRLGGLRQTQPIQSPLGPGAAPSDVGDAGDTVDATRGCSAVFLSAGTDGQDGPTPAAGALAWPSLVAEARAAGADVENALRRNDSFGFYSALGEGLVVTGLTGTNVMDVQLVLVRPRQP